MKTRHRLVACLISGQCAVVGCSSSDGGSSPAGADTAGGSTSASPAGSTAVSADDSSPGTSDSSGQTITFGPGTFDLPDPTVGLGDLTNYRATLTISFDGTRGGAPEQWTKVDTIVVDRLLPGRLRTIERTGRDPVKRSLIEVGGVVYDMIEGSDCSVAAKVSTEPEEGDLTFPDEPADLLPGMLGAEAAGQEVVEGVATTHYTFDERGFGSLDPATALGDVWVADGGGYVVRYSLVEEGMLASLGQTTTGRLTVEYMLAVDVQPIDIAIPADCPPGLIDTPLPPDADQIVSRPGYLHFLAPGAPEAVGAFLDEQLTATGWQPIGDRLTADATSLQSFGRGEDVLTITVSLDPAGTAVTMLLTGAPTVP